MSEIINKSSLLAITDEAIKLTEECFSIQWNDKFPDCIAQMSKELIQFRDDIDTELISEYYYALFSDMLTKYNSGTQQFIENINKGIDRSDFAPRETFDYQENLVRVRYLFSYLGYFNSNIVIVGANGSGKTILANTLKEIITSKSGVVIPAQKIMIVPSYNGLLGSNTTKKNLEELQEKTRDSKVTFDVSKEDSVPYAYMQDFGRDFKIVLDNLLSENNEMVHKRDAQNKSGQIADYSIKSNLEKAIEIWESLIKHRKITCENGYKLQLSGDGVRNYSLYNMSDGEKVILYNIAHVIQAPANSIVVVDEPEMYLHKTVTTQLWNKLEDVRADCLFIYLTHDLEFASCRVDAKKVWIKSFKYDNILLKHIWAIEPLPESKIPDELLLKLLGSRKKILFCEGTDAGSLDKQVFEIIFPNLTICTVNTCKDVINYTQSFNKIPDLHSKAIGIIDTDHRLSSQLSSLKDKGVYSLPYAEIDNLFLDEDFLKLFAAKYDHEEDLVEEIKQEIIKTLESQKELQISNYITSKVNHYFSESHVSKANTKEKIRKNLDEFNSNINIDIWYKERNAELNKIIKTKDYSNVIKVFNNKGLSATANKHFKISNFTEKALKFLKNSSEAQDAILKSFPIEINRIGI